MLFKVAFRCMFYLSFGKHHGDPYYEPTIVVHDNMLAFIPYYYYSKQLIKNGMKFMLCSINTKNPVP